MKSFAPAVFAAAVALASVSAAFAQQATNTASNEAKNETNASAAMSTGEIRKVDKSTGKLTIKHGPLQNLGMDAMTMVFRVKDAAMLGQVKVGDKVRFVAEQPNGQLTVTQLEKQE